MTARTLVSGSSNAVVKVLNLDDREICLNKGDVIGKCEEVVWMKKCSSTTGADLAKSNNYELVTELLDDCKSNLTYSQSMKAKKFLQRYANIFSSHEGDLGRTNKVSYLGHVISSDGIQTDPEKLEAVQKWPTPKDKTEVRAFLGLCSYYRRFVKGFSEIAKPLHRLTEDKRQFSWDGTCEDSFQKLKKTSV
ncbi:uncharacterized protein LOC123666387 [Melitaea cinxia]|uniref:uncharacterized protein LOC123666387 n=1 Tax=Melitaea cinxia TaxID=113334 RepID=UPI001E271FDB|nr:uncharacterized protein LOC123666387 [Melitaea cinxia]